MAKTPAVVLVKSLCEEQEETKTKGIAAPFQFLLTCSETHLSNFEMIKLSEAANFRTKAHEYMDLWYEASLQAELARLFRVQGRERILNALSQPLDAIADAKLKLNPPEEIPVDYIPVVPLPKGQAHRTASMNYQKRNVDEGKCCSCPEPHTRNSVRYCEKHLTAVRERARARARAKRLRALQPAAPAIAAAR
jgi:hypothetical protein